MLGPTAEKLVALTSRHGSFKVRNVSRPNVQPRIEITSNGGGVTQTAAFLGTIRPERLIGKFNLAGGEMTSQHDLAVVAIEKLGMHEIQSIETSTGTYFAEGFAVHNTGTEYAYLEAHAAPVGKWLVGDMAIFGSTSNTVHTSICRKAGSDTSAIFSSNGHESWVFASDAPEPISLASEKAQQHLVGVYRHPALI